MKFRQLGLSEYNNAILEIYGANPVQGLKGAGQEPKPEDPDKNQEVKPQTKLVSSGLLAKETLRLRNTAVLNLKHTEMVFRYEKRRFKELQLQFKGLTSEKESAKDKEDQEREEKKEKSGFEFPNLGKLLKGLLKKLWRKLIPKRIRAKMRAFRMRIKRTLNAFKRRIKVPLKRAWRNATRPFRQGRRFVQRTLNAFKRRIKVPLKRAWRNATRPFRQGRRFVQGKVTKAKDFFKKKALRLKRQTKVNIGRKLQQAQQFGAQKLTQAKSFATSKIDDLNKFKGEKVKQATGFFGDIFQKGKKLGLAGINLAKKGADRLGNIFNTLKDPETYKRVTTTLKKHIGTPIGKLKGAAKNIADDVLKFLYNTPVVQRILNSAIGKRLLTKIGAKGGAKLLGKLIPGVGVILGLADAIYRGTQGDWEGVLISALGAIPIAGWAAIALDLYRELDPEGYTKYIRQGMDKEDMNRVLEGATVEAFAAVGEANAAGAGFGGAFSKGGKVSGPQLVLVGEGGEDEWIIPKSKLPFFLGSNEALNLLNYGAGAVYGGVNQYLNDTGLSNKIPGLTDGDGLEGADSSEPSGLKKLKRLDFGDKIVKFITDIFDKIIDIFKKPWEMITKLWSKIPKEVKSVASGLFSWAGDALTNLMGGSASAATLPPSLMKAGVAGTYATGLKTGASAYIGGSSDYHIDTKFSKSLSMEDRVAMMDKLAAAYAARGRKIEFSNQGVANKVYDPTADLAVKVDLLRRAQSAHGHSRHSNYDSIDYYIPSTGETRYGKSAEGAEILVPTVEGGKITYSQGGGYGAFITLTDEKGKVLLKTGHGDVRTARSGSVTIPKAPPINKPEITETPENYDFMRSMASKVATPAPAQNPLVIPVPMPSGAGGTTFGTNAPAWGLNSVFGN